METKEAHIESTLLRLLTPQQAHRYRIVPKAKDDQSCTFYTDHPKPKRLLQELPMLLGVAVHLEEKDTPWMEKTLAQHYRLNHENRLQPEADFLDKLLSDAQSIGSSDIHIEPLEHMGRVRMRVDGKLIERYEVKKIEYPSVVNKIKVRAGLDISEKRLPQDGRIRVKSGKDGLDLRVSTLPVMNGEKVVMRLLGQSSGDMTLAQLGMDASQQNTYEKALKKPHGVILISGPTGSGKTTTLYATLKNLADTSRNVMTIEDPIEYTLSGIAQVQVKEQIGLTFPTALRTFLRQDPDIIMIGEIRDTETAKMAIRASLTGHQVLSTIHTNSAWDTVMRLQDMGVPGYLVASTLSLSVAQRLVRLVCPHCKSEDKLTNPQWLGMYADKAPENICTSKGCQHCHYTGYKGRKAVYEILPITEELAVGIKTNSLNMQQAYAQAGIMSLADQALRMLQQGETTLEETLPYFIT